MLAKPILLIAGLLVANEPVTPKELLEPPLQFSLNIDGQPTPIEIDVPTTLTVGGVKARATLSVKPERLFSAGGISFRYPRQHAFEVDTSTPGVTQWTFDGNDNVIIFSRITVKADLKEVFDEMVKGITEQFEPGTVKQEPGELNLGGKMLETVDLTVKVAATTLHQKVAGFTAGETVCLFVVQDSPKDDGSRSDETALVLKLLAESFKME